MNISAPFKELMERRLWPIALLLVAALVAVPMVLKSEEEPVAAPLPISSGPTGEAGPDDAAVALADSGRTDKVRSVLGDRKDPFRPAAITEIPKEESADSTGGRSIIEAAREAAGAIGGGGTGGGTTDVPASSGGTTTVPAPTIPDAPDEPAAPKPTFELYSLVVKFGDATGTQESKVIERLTGLPGGNPAILYLGLLADHKTAAFMVDDTVEVTGDGKCDPSPEECQTLTLKEGETEFFTRGEKTWQLDLTRIITKKTFDRGEAVAARQKVARGGKRALRRLDGRRRFRYNATTGTLATVARSTTKPKRASFAGSIESSG